MNCSAVSERSGSKKCSRHSCASPLPSSNRQRSRKFVSRAGGLAGLQVLARHRLEAQHHGGQLPLRRMLQQAIDQRLMTQMQAVKAADGDDTVAGLSGI